MKHNIDPIVLSQLLTIYNYLDILSTDQKLAEFLGEALKCIPGVRVLTLCLRDFCGPKMLASPPDICRTCPVNAGRMDDDWRSRPCHADNSENPRIYPIETQRRVFGCALADVDPASEYPLYEPYVRNLFHMVAATLENRRQESHLKSVNRELQESEKRYRAVIENSLLGIALRQGDHFLFANQVFCDMIGRSEEELLKTTAEEFVTFIHPDDFQMIYQRHIDRVSGKPVPSRYEYRYVHKNGSIVWVDALAHNISAGEGQMQLGMYVDITARKIAEEKNMHAEQRFRTMFEEAPLGIALIDSLNGNIYEVNARFAEIAGRTREEMANIDWMSITHPDDVQEDLDNMAHLNAGEIEGFNMHKRYIRPDGSAVWISMTIAPVWRQDASRPRHLCMIENITEQKRAEMQLKEYSKRLEEMVEERAIELKQAQDELLVKERLAVLGHFAGSISHELRNPLGAIDASVYYLEMKLGGGDEKTKIHLGRVRSNVKKSTAIIESLLNLSRMEKPKTVQTDLTAFLPKVIWTAKIPPTVETALDLPDRPIFAAIDPEQIRMALKNIIQNSVQAMDWSGALTIAARLSAAGDVEISVADTGPGISPKHVERVFEPLFSTKTHGIGFGLSITKMILENHGGTIRAEAPPDGGAAIILTLPL